MKRTAEQLETLHDVGEDRPESQISRDQPASREQPTAHGAAAPRESQRREARFREEPSSHGESQSRRESQRDFGAGETPSGVRPVAKTIAKPAHDTFWQPRLILSTLDPRSIWAGRLRLAIRQGNRPLVDSLLDSIYDERARGEIEIQTPDAVENSESIVLKKAELADERVDGEELERPTDADEAIESEPPVTMRSSLRPPSTVLPPPPGRQRAQRR